MVKIKDLPLSERPRERLINFGKESLNNEELLAILIKTGTKDMSAKEIASELLSKLHNISELSNINYNQLSKIKGIGPSKASFILSAIELGKRINTKYDSIVNLKFDNPKTIFDYYAPILGSKKQEHFYAVYLDNQKKIISEKLLFIGTLNKSLIHPQNIFKEAYLLDASSIICIHNHPSGNILPSKEDIIMTKNLEQIGNLFGIKIIDHVIIGDKKYYSFFESGDIT